MNPNHIGTNFDDFLKEEGIIMNDRFKFRFYDKENKIMVYADTDNELLPYRLDGIYTTWQTYDLSAIENLAKNEDYIVMQSTGLKDKNGKLIYEGDICRNSKSGEVFNVVWHNPLASFCWQKHEHSYIYSYGELFRAFDYYEIVGNIYENKELLNAR